MLHHDYSGALRNLDRQLRSALAWLGILELLIILGLAVAASFALDYLFELPWLLRAAAFFGVLWLFFRITRASRRRLRASVPPGDFLITLENYNPDLEGQLLTSMEFQEHLERAQDQPLRPLEDHLLQCAALEARQAASATKWQKAIDGAVVRKRFAGACGALGLILALAWAFPAAFQVWAMRNVFLLAVPWPRQTHFAIDGEGGVWHHPRLEPLPITAWVLGSIPRTVSIRIDAAGESKENRVVPGVARKGSWNLFSDDPAGSKELQEAMSREEVEGRQLAYTIPSPAESLRFYFTGGDNRSRTIQVEVHDRPRFIATRVTLKYPKHTEFPAKTLTDPAGEIAAITGTTIELEVEADQAIQDAWIKVGENGRTPALSVEDRKLRHAFQLKESCFLEFGAASASWKFEAVPQRLAIAAIPDNPPQIALAVEGENRMVVPDAAIPYRVEASDDFGFHSLQLKLVRSEAGSEPASPEGSEGPKPEIIDLAPWTAEKSAQGALVRLERRLELAPMHLEPGMRLILQAAARDSDEPAGFKETLSNTETFLIVDAEKLREAMNKVRVEAQTRLEELAHRELEIASAVTEAAGRQAQEGRSSDAPPEAIRSTERNPQKNPSEAGARPESRPEVSSRNNPQERNPRENNPQEKPAKEEKSQDDPEQANPEQNNAGQENPRQSNPRQNSAQQNSKQQKNPPRSNPRENNPQQNGEQQAETQPQESQPQEAQPQETQPQDPQQSNPRQNNRPSNPRRSNSQRRNPQSSRPNQQNSEQPNSEQQNGNPEEQPQEEPAESPENQPQDPQKNRQPGDPQAEQRPKENPLAEEQKRISEEARRVARRVEEMTKVLNDNKLIDPNEARRFEDEIAKPLEELTQDGLPRSEENLKALPKSPRPQNDRAEAKREAENLARQLKDVADRLGESKGYGEVLQRLQLILELQGKVIEQTGKGVGQKKDF